ncbi:hypothetical protein ACS0TY_018102 [Phlomoides rotata]
MDAALFGDRTVGLGFVVRDDFGRILIAGSKRCRGGSSSTFVEAMMLHFRLETTLLGGLSVHIVESDSERLVRTINTDINDEPYILSMVDDIKMLARETHFSTFQHAHRQGRTVVVAGPGCSPP